MDNWSDDSMVEKKMHFLRLQTRNGGKDENHRKMAGQPNNKPRFNLLDAGQQKLKVNLSNNWHGLMNSYNKGQENWLLVKVV